MQSIKEKIPGISVAIIIGMIGKYFSNWLPNIGGVTLSIIIGLMVGNAVNFNKTFYKGVNFIEKKLLALAIMLMGLKLELTVLSELGIPSLIIIVLMVGITVLAGVLIGKIFGLSKSFSMLLGIGNGICGSSAIAATAPIINTNEDEIGISISVVNLLGTIGIFLLPSIIYFMSPESSSSGLMIGSTIQSTGQVVAAGFSVSDQVGRIATIVKMGRILMLGPVILILSFMNKNKKGAINSGVKIPPFIIGFFIFSIIGTLHFLPSNLSTFLKNSSKFLLIIAMAGIGLKIRFSSLIKQGTKALLVGFLIFGIQLILITSLIYFLF